MGIRNVVAGYIPNDRTKRLENVVYNHLLYSGYDVKAGGEIKRCSKVAENMHEVK